MLPDSRVPGNWQAFLRVDDNKTELFGYVSEELKASKPDLEDQKQVITTKREDVLSWQPKDTNRLSPCTQKESDTRMLLHAQDAAQDGLRRVMLRTVDTDVVVIAIFIFPEIAASELWVAFGVGKYFRYVAIHEIVNGLGPSKSSGLLFFHAFTGCD